MTRIMRAVAFGCSAVAVLLAGARVVWSNVATEDPVAVAMMGGALASTPFVLACAVEEFLRERRSKGPAN